MALKQNIIYVYFKGKHLTTSKSQYQYNHGQFLYFADLDLPQAFEVHFSNEDKGYSKPKVGSNKLVEIPDEYFWSGASQIYAWVYLHSDTDDGETIYEVKIPLTKRAKPTDEEPLPQQESAMERAIAELNNAVEITTENANKTEEDKTQVGNIRDEVVDLKENIDATAETVAQKSQEAIDASRRSEASAQNAAEFEEGARNYSESARQSAQEALESKNTAKQKAQVANDASAEAKYFRDEAETFKNEAEQAKQNIVDYRDETKGYRDEALTAKDDTQTIKSDVQSLKTQIDDTADNIFENAREAYQSMISADNASLSASESAENAGRSANEANQSATNAFESASQAEEFKNQSATNVTHYPKVVDGYWYVWDASKNEYVNTNVDARGVKGDKGDVGNGIENTVLNSDYTLTITFTDGTSYTTPSIRGEKGIKGDVGNGIASTVLNDDYTLTITFTDGTTYKTPSIRGEKGEKGEPATDMDIHICSASEYDSETRIPTITSPDDKTFYLVPTEDGTSPDLFTEWVYVNNAWEMFGSAKIDLSGYLTDVQINGTSIVENGVANVPIASPNALGTVKVGREGGIFGIRMVGLPGYEGEICVNKADVSTSKAGRSEYKPITPSSQHAAAFYGLAKAAGDTTQSSSNNAVGNYTEEAKDKIQTMLGVSPLIAPHESDPFESTHVVGELFIINGKLYRAKTVLTAGEYINEGTNVEVVDTSDVYVKNTDIAGDNYGLVKLKNGDHGLGKTSSGFLRVYQASIGDIKTGAQVYRPIVPNHQHEAIFYGLAKASGDTTQSQSDNAVGTYTDEAKASIQTMLGVPSEDDVVNDVQIDGSSIVSNGVAEIPIMSANTFGVAKLGDSNGLYGLEVQSTGGYANILRITPADINHIKNGIATHKPITPKTQHQSVFYGLTKAAGVDMSQSSNAVGTYTDEAKTAIKTMLGVHDTYDSFIEEITGTDVTIIGQPSYRYNCGEVLSLSITPPSSGTIDIRFTSGSTPTVLTLPQTVKMPEWWVEVEANTIYEMCITDGIYCGVMSWAI